MRLIINSSLNYGENEDEFIFLFPSEMKYLKIKGSDIIRKVFEIVRKNKDYQSIVNEIKKMENRSKVMAMLKFFIKKKIIIEYIEEINDVRYGNQIEYLISKKDDVNLGINLQEQITNFKVMIIGAGAIGSNLAVLLATSGVNSIEVIDGDIVELSNLTRQFFYTENDALTKVHKVDSLGKFINRLNSQVNYFGTAEFVEKNYTLKNEKPQLIIQTADNPFGKLDQFINQVAVTNNIPVLYVHSNLVGPFVSDKTNSCFNCFELWINNDSNGMYQELVNNFSPDCNPKYPSISHGSLIISSVLFEYIVEFIEYSNIHSLEKNIYDVKNKEYILLKECSNCEKNRR